MLISASANSSPPSVFTVSVYASVSPSKRFICVSGFFPSAFTEPSKMLPAGRSDTNTEYSPYSSSTDATPCALVFAVPAAALPFLQLTVTFAAGLPVFVLTVAV